MKTSSVEAQERLRVLIADLSTDSLTGLAGTIRQLGHEVIEQVTDLALVGKLTASHQPDVAIVVAGEDSAHVLAMIDKVVREAVCPVIAVLESEDQAFIKEAARLGVFAYICKSGETADLQSSIDIVLCRFAEYQNLEGAFARRAVTERAKGILMERHGVAQDAAFQMLRDDASRSGRQVIDIAEAIVASYRILPSLRGNSAHSEKGQSRR